MKRRGQHQAPGDHLEPRLQDHPVPVGPGEEEHAAPHEEHEQPQPHGPFAALREEGGPDDAQEAADVEEHGEHEGGGAEQDQQIGPEDRQLDGKDQDQHGDVEDHGAHLSVPLGALHLPRDPDRRQAQDPLDDLLEAEQGEDPVDERPAAGQADQQGRLGELVRHRVQQLPHVGGHVEVPGDIAVSHVRDGGEEHRAHRQIALFRNDVKPDDHGDQKDTEQAQGVGDGEDILFAQSFLQGFFLSPVGRRAGVGQILTNILYTEEQKNGIGFFPASGRLFRFVGTAKSGSEKDGKTWHFSHPMGSRKKGHLPIDNSFSEYYTVPVPEK